MRIILRGDFHVAKNGRPYIYGTRLPALSLLAQSLAVYSRPSERASEADGAEGGGGGFSAFIATS